MAKSRVPASNRAPPSRPRSTVVVAPRNLSLPAAYRRGDGNAVVGGLYDAADRLRAVAQRLRPAEDLDLLNRERIDRHAVVLAEVGDVHGADAVLLHADAEVVEPAQHRPRRPGARPADVAPGSVKNRLPKLWAGLA